MAVAALETVNRWFRTAGSAPRVIGRFVVIAAATVAVAALGSACSSATVDRGALIVVHLRDFHLKVSPSSIRAGTVTFRVHNDGPSTHEINVDRTTLAPSALPLRKDGMSVNEDSTHLKRIASIEEVFDGARDDLTVTLTKGHYVLYCNMEGHYRGDMRTSIDVR